jgi:proteasome activator subunit 4
MDSHLIDNKRITSVGIHDNDLQKPNIYNKYLPFHEFIAQQGCMLFDEIRENLSRTIQLGELEPGFSVWSKKLERFISLYGFNFTKIDHLKLINLYLSVLSITDLNYQHVETCSDMLYELLRFVFDFFFSIM